ncbi:MAG TPA: bifunctional 4-hydroxy-2-oxoglutarate aldolase/2-dehydro-3-deoxy-phosphogluconate aldolase [Chitinophagaceae bacterium]|nr:bifunctional 4-hydroxy-2-oxoglutarate aldolase/2-dehydro-3-deoxy-phosphogluconate aldolase [Chitinophagaceae bacterium]
MSKQQSALDGLLQQRLLPLFYHDDADTCVNILQALYNAGIRLVEYTHRGPNALVNFSVLQQCKQQMPGLQLGIGTIKNPGQAENYIAAGADFIVCPTTEPAVGSVVSDAGLLWIPGCMTPTEIGKAEAAGAKLVKIFPGNILGPSYINAIKDLFPGMRFMPTGGVEVNRDNLQSWFNAGVSAVGMGSRLVSDPLVKEKDFAAIEELTRQALDIVNSISQ